MTQPTPTLKPEAERAAQRLIDDLSDRKGIRQWWGTIDNAVKDEIKTAWAGIIEQAAPAAAVGDGYEIDVASYNAGLNMAMGVCRMEEYTARGGFGDKIAERIDSYRLAAALKAAQGGD